MSPLDNRCSLLNLSLHQISSSCVWIKCAAWPASSLAASLRRCQLHPRGCRAGCAGVAGRRGTPPSQPCFISVFYPIPASSNVNSFIRASLGLKEVATSLGAGRGTGAMRGGCFPLQPPRWCNSQETTLSKQFPKAMLIALHHLSHKSQQKSPPGCPPLPASVHTTHLPVYLSVSPPASRWRAARHGSVLMNGAAMVLKGDDPSRQSPTSLCQGRTPPCALTCSTPSLGVSPHGKAGSARGLAAPRSPYLPANVLRRTKDLSRDKAFEKSHCS